MALALSRLPVSEPGDGRRHGRHLQVRLQVLPQMPQGQPLAQALRGPEWASHQLAHTKEHHRQQVLQTSAAPLMTAPPASDFTAVSRCTGFTWDRQ